MGHNPCPSGLEGRLQTRRALLSGLDLYIFLERQFSFQPFEGLRAFQPSQQRRFPVQPPHDEKGLSRRRLGFAWNGCSGGPGLV